VGCFRADLDRHGLISAQKKLNDIAALTRVSGFLLAPIARTCGMMIRCP